MPMVAGTVSVDSSEVATGTGMAKAIYDADKATMSLPALPTLGQTTAPYRPERPATAADIALVQAARVQMLQDAARRATAYAYGVVSHVVSYAQARVSTSQSVGRTPNPNNADTAIQPPASDVYLPIA